MSDTKPQPCTVIKDGQRYLVLFESTMEGTVNQTLEPLPPVEPDAVHCREPFFGYEYCRACGWLEGDPPYEPPERPGVRVHDEGTETDLEAQFDATTAQDVWTDDVTALHETLRRHGVKVSVGLVTDLVKWKRGDDL